MNETLTRRSTGALLLAILLVMAPLLLLAPAPLCALLLVSILWRTLIEFGSLRAPRNDVTLTCGGIIAVAGMGLSLKEGNVLEAALWLSATMLAGSVLGSPLHRSRAMGCLFHCGFLILALTILDPGGSRVLSVISVFYLAGVLYEMHLPQGATLSLWTIVRGIFLLLLPVSAVLGIAFVMFPKLQSTFLSGGAGQATTGFAPGGELAPGDIARIAQSDRLAFRARLTPALGGGDIRVLYWRGATLLESDGLRWHGQVGPDVSGRDAAGAHDEAAHDAAHDEAHDETAQRGTPTLIMQDILLEPTFEFALPALDRPLQVTMTPATEVPGQGQSNHVVPLTDGTFTAATSVNDRLLYYATSDIKALALPAPPLNERDRKHYLQVPAKLSTRVLALAKELQGGSTQDRADHILHYFAGHHFQYTLEPGVLPDDDALDRFLFETRLGFCEHYAAAFATLARLMALPARVVVGYAGGELNPYDGFVYVRDADAHAWVEVWSDETNRWTRIDPTSVVAPAGLGLRAHRKPQTLFGHPMPGWMLKISRFFQDSSLAMDAMSTRGTLLRMAPHTRDTWKREARDLWKGLGGSLLVFVCVVALLCVACACFFWRSARKRARRASSDDALVRAYARYCEALKKLDLPKDPSEGPLSYCARCSAALPALAPELEQFTSIYTALRYGPGPHADTQNSHTQRSGLRSLEQGLKAVRRATRRSPKVLLNAKAH